MHTTIAESIHTTPNFIQSLFKAGLYRIGCGVHRLGDSAVHTLGDTSVGQLLLIAINSELIAEWNDVGIVFEIYIAPL